MQTKPASVRQQLEQCELQAAFGSIWGLVDRANQYIAQTEPYKMKKDLAQAARLDEVLYNLCEACRVLAVLLWPFLPDTATKIYAQLGLSGAPDKFELSKWGGLPSSHKVSSPVPLFPRKDV